MTVDGLRILMVSPALPLPSWGFGTRVYQLARHLSKRHSLTILTYARPDEGDNVEDLLSQVCHEARLIRRRPIGGLRRRQMQLASIVSPAPFLGRELRTSGMQRAIDELLSREPFDIIQLESSQMCTYRFPARPQVVLDEHNIEYELLQRMHGNERSRARRLYNQVEHRKFARFERRWWNEVDAVAVTSEREDLIVRRHAPRTPTGVVPNAVDPEYFSPSGREPEKETIVFAGLLTYRPNLDAVEYLADEILPRVLSLRPECHLTVVGGGQHSDLERLRRANVLATGWVPDVRPYLAAASVVVAPLRVGGGTRLKVVEAMAMGKAIVTTSLGCEGLAVRNGEHLLIADDPADFASAIARVLSDRALSRRLGEAGRALALTGYSWDQAGARLEDLYGQVVARPRSRL